MSISFSVSCSDKVPSQKELETPAPLSPIIRITHNGEVLAILLPADFQHDGIHFLTPDEFSQQLAYIKHPEGKVIKPHVHNSVAREILFTQEVLLIKRGKLRVDFYTSQQEYLESYILKAGDVILLAQGAHGFQVLEEVEMIEVKQGPYVGDHNTTRFSAVEENQVIIKR
jgi:hypothetical protein